MPTWPSLAAATSEVRADRLRPPWTPSGRIAVTDEVGQRKLDVLQRESSYPILTEETGDVGEILEEKPFWVLDPLDGTMNYLKGIPLCCVSLGLFQNKDPILGLIYDFNRGELFKGVVGEKAFCNIR